MCGIVSIFSLQGGVSESSLMAGLNTLSHRGPDGFGKKLSQDKRVGLGHARLALVDINDGKQPLSNKEGSILAVVNGEFYDYESLTQKLKLKGHHFNSQSDSEIIIHLYAEYGMDFIEHLDGEFAFLLWDERKNRLIVGRDRFGIKPLLWSEYNNQVFFASEAKALFAMGVPADWDKQAFFQMSSMQYLNSDATLFANIHQLPAGHLLILDQSGINKRCYWDLNLPLSSERTTFKSKAEAVTEVRTSLSHAVSRRLRADNKVNIATQLSGGIDSSVVAALAAKEGISKCFSISFKHTEAPYNEAKLAQETAKSLNLDLQIVSLAQGDLASSLFDAVEKSEGIAINAHLPAKYLLSQAMNKAGYQVALTGEGADELFLGYPHLAADFSKTSPNCLKSSQSLPIKEQASSGIMLPSGDGLSTDSIQNALGFVPCFLSAKAGLGLKMRSFLHPQFTSIFKQNKWDPFTSYLDSVPVVDQLNARSRVNQSRYLWTKSAMTGYILQTLGDGTEMSHSVEGRVPFLDKNLYDVVKKIPEEWMLEPMAKQILREAVKGLVPEAVRLREKHPFISPPVFLSSAFIHLAKDVLHSNFAKHHPFIHATSVLKAIETLPLLKGGERSAWDAAIMMALTSIMLGEVFSL